MAEKLNSKRSRNLLAIGLGGLAFGGGPNTADARLTPKAQAPAVEPTVLIAGGNIDRVPKLSPKQFKDSKVRLTPKSKYDTEDLAVVFDKKESDYLRATKGEIVRGDSVGFVIESAVGKTAVRYVFFKPASGQIDVILDAIPVNFTEKIYDYVSPVDASQTYSTYIAPQINTGGAIVSFKHPNPHKPDMHSALAA